MLSAAEEIRTYIDNINFGPIIKRVVKEKGWLKEEAEEIVSLYKRFLFLQKKHDGEHYLVPTPDIDEIWHAHILYTKEYHEASEALFGRYLHHQPEEPMSVADALNPPDLTKGFELTQELYFKEYGEYIPDIRAYHTLGQAVVTAIKLFRYGTAKLRRGERLPRQGVVSKEASKAESF